MCDYLFDKDKILAYLTLDDNELFIYQRLYDLLARDLPYSRCGRLPPVPDRQAPEAPEGPGAAFAGLPQRRRRESRRTERRVQPLLLHYAGAPLLVVETSSLDLDWQDEDVEDLLRQIEHMQQGTQYYVPRQR